MAFISVSARSIRASLAASSLLCASAGLAAASYDFHIAAGPLDRALTAYGAVTGQSILYPSELVAGRTAPALDGRMSSERALEQLLRGADIAVRRPSASVVVLSAGPPRSRAPAAAIPSRQQPRPRQRTSDPQVGAPAGTEIVVTGSNIRGTRDGVSPLVTIDPVDMNRRGFGTIAQAVQNIPQNFAGTTTEATALAGTDRTSFNDGIGSGVNLRGLGSDATLTLINGRRVAGGGAKGDFTDLSLIPTIALSRIEVLADGASAIYGSDAVGGVVNVLLRNRLDGAESRLRVGTVTKGGAQELQFGQIGGTGWETGNLVLAYEYYHRDALASDARRYTRSADLRPLGGDDFRSYYAVPGTILGYDPTSGTYVPVYAIPDDQDGVGLRPSDLADGSSLVNQQQGTDLLPRQSSHLLYGHVDQSVGTGIDLYAEGGYARRRYSYAAPASEALLTVTPDNPFFVSPDGSDFGLIAYSFARELGPVQTAGRVQSYNGTAGAKVTLGGDWEADGYVSHARATTDNRSSNIVNTTRLDQALGNAPVPAEAGYSVTADGFFNPFGSGSSNSAATLVYVGSGFSTEALRSMITSANIKVDGTLARLPGGPLKLAAGGTWRRERFRRTGLNFYTGDTPAPIEPSIGRRSMGAGFAELSVPVVGPNNASPGIEMLRLSAAVRYERYSDFGDTTNPKVGLVWEPASGLTLRGSYGTSFRAPAIPEINDPLRVSPTQLPNRSGGYTPVLFLTGGNRDLTPERARSYSVGARFAPRRWPGFGAEFTFFQTRFKGQIGKPAFENILVALQDPSLAPFVTAVSPATSAEDLATVQQLIAAPGSIVPGNLPPTIFQAIVDSRYVNTAELIVRGIDLAFAGSTNAAGGRLSANVQGTYLLDYKQRQTPAAPLTERVDLVGYPAAFRGHATFDWSRDRFGVSATLNHVGSYRDTLSLPARKVGSWTTLDMQLRYEPGWRGLASGMSLALSVQNLLDTDPPFVNRAAPLGYDPANASPLGRFLVLQVSKSW